MQGLRRERGLLTAAPTRVVLAEGAGRDRVGCPHLEFVAVLFMVSSFNLRNYLSTRGKKKMFFILYKKKHGLPSGFYLLKWDLRMSISYLYLYL